MQQPRQQHRAARANPVAVNANATPDLSWS
jgi:hypothetical protein